MMNSEDKKLSNYAVKFHFSLSFDTVARHEFRVGNEAVFILVHHFHHRVNGFCDVLVGVRLGLLFLAVFFCDNE